MKESRKEFIREAHKAACSDWKQKIEKEFPSLFEKPKFEIGKWYKNGNALVCYQGGNSGYGVTKNSRMLDVRWNESDVWSFKSEPYNWQPATEKEVEEALKKEAKKRGLDSPNVVCLFNPKDDLYKEGQPEWELNFSEKNVCSLWYYNLKIFHNGKWATLLETITKEEAEKQLGKKIVD